MNDNKMKMNSMIIAAVLGMSQMAAAEVTKTFTRFEDLPPEQRAAVGDKLDQLSLDVKIDWQNVEVGVDEKGRLNLRARDAAFAAEAGIGQPTCASGGTVAK